MNLITVNKGTIVCVDDEEMILDTLRQQLRDAFSETHKIHTATSGDEALEIIRTLEKKGELLEMIICDQVMPGLKGDELLAEIHNTYPDTIKILLTGQAGFSDVISAVNDGGLNYYVAKPWDGEELKKRLIEFIKSFRQTMENQRLIFKLEQRIKELEEEIQSL